MRKQESRVLVYRMGQYYSVFATFRKEFIEELYITQNPILLLYLPRILSKNMRTLEEITMILPCNQKYSPLVFHLPLRVVEGGEELVLKLKYCSLIDSLVCMLEKRAYIRLDSNSLLYQISDKCLMGEEIG